MKVLPYLISNVKDLVVPDLSRAVCCTLQSKQINHSFTEVSEQTHMLEIKSLEITYVSTVKNFPTDYIC